ncbi:hypothetical protein [Sneathiella sp. HT1-7]|uniref:hypothetical protein n=1 Tax=Sneathiella sp. HT1-7 TaxID=2887192 RepID=UPI001D15086E|nr:hypothetical protein [Sneathiella sp. HT1-7]MCC3304698.1 hypothetical protein [Sneathiella sp. HT1-7]
MDWIKVGISALLGGAVAAAITAFLVIYFDKPAANPKGGNLMEQLTGSSKMDNRQQGEQFPMQKHGR